MAIRIGCGSWADDDYAGLLFPKKLPKTERLRAYAQWFERIELNATYHALPPRARVAEWVSQTPEGFLFDVKLPNWFSTTPSASIQGTSVDKLLSVIRPMIDAHRLGGFLFTLLPSFSPKKNQLSELDGLAKRFEPFPVAVEIRHRGWIEEDRLSSTLDYFRQNQLAWVALDLPPLVASPILPPIDEVTHPSRAYMRLHGRNPDYLKKGQKASERHRYEYSEAELHEIIARIQSLASRAESVHVSVNTHCDDLAPKNALALRRLLGQPVPPPLEG